MTIIPYSRCHDFPGVLHLLWVLVLPRERGWLEKILGKTAASRRSGTPPPNKMEIFSTLQIPISTRNSEAGIHSDCLLIERRRIVERPAHLAAKARVDRLIGA